MIARRKGRIVQGVKHLRRHVAFELRIEQRPLKFIPGVKEHHIRFRRAHRIHGLFQAHAAPGPASALGRIAGRPFFSGPAVHGMDIVGVQDRQLKCLRRRRKAQQEQRQQRQADFLHHFSFLWTGRTGTRRV